MAKVIKEQIKKTSSLFLIISLILNFTVYGLMFNLNIDQLQNAKVGLSKEANAASNNASTTLTVKNSPPSLASTTPYESQISSSTSPINVGGTISFNLPNNAVTDQESNDFRLIICSGSSNATITPAQAISCIGGTELCHSGYASSTQAVSSSTSCTYNNVADPGAESRVWQAYVCDSHSSQPGCSQVGYGQGDSGSPFYINHVTTVASATTSVNNINPGQAFTVSATTSDSDTLRGIDISGIVVCATSSFSTTTNTCQGVTYCSSTLSASVSHSCATTTSAPLAHGNYTYQVYAVDWQGFSSTSKQSGSYDVNDVAPYNLNVNLNNNTNITLNAKYAGDKVVRATTTVADDNGCADMVSATSTLFESAVAGGGNCSPDDNDCYATSTGCVKIAGCSGVTADFVCTFDLKYHAQPTDTNAGNTRSADIWTASTRVFDGSNNTVATNSSQTVELLQAAALDISETFIDYGVLVTGTTTGAYNATTSVNNFGNTPLDAQVYGTDMNRNGGGGSIAANNQKFGNAYAIYSALPNALDTINPGPTVTLDVFRPTSFSTTTKGIYWGINVPFGLSSGDYGGKNTFTAVVNGSGVGW